LQFYQTLHRLMILFAVNLPLLGVRLVLWHHEGLPVSSFIVKNLAVSFLIFYNFYERDHHSRLQNLVLNQTV
jgi:EamA domain-containing membrane protein RarD